MHILIVTDSALELAVILANGAHISYLYTIYNEEKGFKRHLFKCDNALLLTGANPSANLIYISRASKFMVRII